MVDPQNAHSRITGSCACVLLVFGGPKTANIQIWKVHACSSETHLSEFFPRPITIHFMGYLMWEVYT